MTREEAEEYAKTMTFQDAINNLKQAKSIPYKKATLIKVNELTEALEQMSAPKGTFEKIWNDIKVGDETTHINKYDLRGMLIEANVNGYAEGLKNSKEPKTGHWTEDKDSCVFICSECGRSELWDAPYCPNCGAKMESEVSDGQKQ